MSLTSHALLCIVVDMTSLLAMQVSYYTAVDMAVCNANLYRAPVRSSSYIRMWQEVADWLIAAFVWICESKHYGKSQQEDACEWWWGVSTWTVEWEYCDSFKSICSNHSEINLKIWSCGEQSASSDEEEYVGGSMQHAAWHMGTSGAEQQHLSLTGEPGINNDLEVPSNQPLRIFWAVCTPEIV
jgi:hypothetical protein